ncbi:hypothetical protein GJ496_011885 [Pomphorhynchus laevis]|nr:hypothetical protein GJ496_011885 [Pomphorhynchus laevis]
MNILKNCNNHQNGGQCSNTTDSIDENSSIKDEYSPKVANEVQPNIDGICNPSVEAQLAMNQHQQSSLYSNSFDILSDLNRLAIKHIACGILLLTIGVWLSCKKLQISKHFNDKNKTILLFSNKQLNWNGILLLGMSFIFMIYDAGFAGLMIECVAFILLLYKVEDLNQQQSFTVDAKNLSTKCESEKIGGHMINALYGLLIELALVMCHILKRVLSLFDNYPIVMMPSSRSSKIHNSNQSNCCCSCKYSPFLYYSAEHLPWTPKGVGSDSDISMCNCQGCNAYRWLSLNLDKHTNLIDKSSNNSNINFSSLDKSNNLMSFRKSRPSDYIDVDEQHTYCNNEWMKSYHLKFHDLREQIFRVKTDDSDNNVAAIINQGNINTGEIDLSKELTVKTFKYGGSENNEYGYSVNLDQKDEKQDVSVSKFRFGQRSFSSSSSSLNGNQSDIRVTNAINKATNHDKCIIHDGGETRLLEKHHAPTKRAKSVTSSLDMDKNDSCSSREFISNGTLHHQQNQSNFPMCNKIKTAIQSGTLVEPKNKVQRDKTRRTFSFSESHNEVTQRQKRHHDKGINTNFFDMLQIFSAYQTKKQQKLVNSSKTTTGKTTADGTIAMLNNIEPKRKADVELEKTLLTSKMKVVSSRNSIRYSNLINDEKFKTHSQRDYQQIAGNDDNRFNLINGELV